MRVALKILAFLFLLCSIAAIYDGALKVAGYREARVAGQEMTQVQLSALAKSLTFTWIFAGIYGAIGMGLLLRRRFLLVIILLFAALVGQWMNVGYRNVFVLSFVALVIMAAPGARSSFRN